MYILCIYYCVCVYIYTISPNFKTPDISESRVSHALFTEATPLIMKPCKMDMYEILQGNVCLNPLVYIPETIYILSNCFPKRVA